MNDDTATDLVMEGAHHRNISVVFITQIYFFKASNVELHIISFC